MPSLYSMIRSINPVAASRYPMWSCPTWPAAWPFNHVLASAMDGARRLIAFTKARNFASILLGSFYSGVPWSLFGCESEINIFDSREECLGCTVVWANGPTSFPQAQWFKEDNSRVRHHEHCTKIGNSSVYSVPAIDRDKWCIIKEKAIFVTLISPSIGTSSSNAFSIYVFITMPLSISVEILGVCKHLFSINTEKNIAREQSNIRVLGTQK